MSLQLHKGIRTQIIVLLWLVQTLCLSSLHAQQNFNTTVVDSIYYYQTESMTAYGDILYLSSMDWIVTFDISDMRNPVFLDTLTWPDKYHRYNFAMNITVIPPYLYAMASNNYDTTFNGLLAIDISDPGDLQKKYFFPLQWRGYQYDNYRLLVWNNFLYAVDGKSLFVFDVSRLDSAKIIETMAFGVPPDIMFSRFPISIRDSSMFASYVVEGMPYNRDSLRVLRLHSDGDVSPLKTFVNVENDISAVYCSDSLLFVGHSVPYTCSIYSIGPDYTVDSLTSIEFNSYNGYPTAIQLSGNYLYVLFGYFGCFSVFDVTNPAFPVLVAEFSESYNGAVTDMIIKDEYLILSTDNDLVIVVKVDLPTSSHEALPAPSTLSLAPAYPNPFSGSTTITYSLPAQQYISLEVYNTLGRKVQTLYSGSSEPGTHSARLNASALPVGTYQVVLRSGEGVQTQMVVVR